MVMYANEFETKEKQKLTEIKNKLQHIQTKHDNYYCLPPSLRLGCSEYTLENWLTINN